MYTFFYKAITPVCKCTALLETTFCTQHNLNKNAQFGFYFEHN